MVWQFTDGGNFEYDDRRKKDDAAGASDRVRGLCSASTVNGWCEL